MQYILVHFASKASICDV